MNKSAVAMAADSTVTISAGRAVKTYDTANKLFEPIRGRPVGMMIYANAELNGVPWEPLIKAYRESRAGASHATLEEYYQDVLTFLTDPGCPLLGPASEAHAFRAVAYDALLDVAAPVVEGADGYVSGSGRVVKSRALRELRNSIAETREFLDDCDNAPWAEELESAGLRSTFEQEATELVDGMFSAFPMLARDRRNLVDIALDACLKDVSVSSESGLVLAGFGESEAFPSLRHSYVRGRICGVLRVSPMEPGCITFDEPGYIQPFAQSEVANQYLFGISGEMRMETVKFWRGWRIAIARALPSHIKKALPSLGAATVTKLVSEFKTITKSSTHDFAQHMANYERVRYREPLLRSVSLLPREELALVAESLVNLTSLRQRMMVNQSQTVGGEIDVALISRGDGLVWLKRKHYFPPELNPLWTTLRSNMIGKQEVLDGPHT